MVLLLLIEMQKSDRHAHFESDQDAVDDVIRTLQKELFRLLGQKPPRVLLVSLAEWMVEAAAAEEESSQSTESVASDNDYEPPATQPRVKVEKTGEEKKE